MTCLPWQWNVSKRRLLMDSPLFDDGNRACYSPAKHPLSVEEEDVTDDSTAVEEYVCGLASCGQTFKSHASYESHYSLVHSRMCHACKRSFPTDHLLDIHLLEWHDAMFELMAQKQPMYQCLVESCDCKFSTRKNRKNHVVKVHKYPSNFRFDREQRHGKESTQPMEVEIKSADKINSDMNEDNGTVPQKRQFSYKVPNTICFGQGTSRGFPRSRGRGRGHQKGQYWHNKGQGNMDTHVDIEKIDLQGLQDALS